MLLTVMRVTLVPGHACSPLSIAHDAHHTNVTAVTIWVDMVASSLGVAERTA